MVNKEGLYGLWSHKHIAECEQILTAIRLDGNHLDFEDMTWEAAKEFAEFWHKFKANKVR